MGEAERARALTGCECCGREATPGRAFCQDCEAHVLLELTYTVAGNRRRMPFERTYFAQHGRPCPFRCVVGKPLAEVEGSPKLAALAEVTTATRKVVEASQRAHDAMRERAARRKDALAAGATPAEVSEAIAAGHPAGWRPQ